MTSTLTPRQRRAAIRRKHARLAAIEAEARAIRAELLPLETEESWSLGFKCPTRRGQELLNEMNRRDAQEEAA